LVILEKNVDGLSRSSMERFLLRAGRAAGLEGRANVLVTGSPELRALNRRFRGKNRATDVLSFPAPRVTSNRSGDAGDIAISADIASDNAARLRHSTADEIKILALHGVLHLAGYDHERDNGRMARKEQQLRRTLGLPGGLIERSQPRRNRRRRPDASRPGKP
jgi:probable rRNA maturation factor